MGRNRYYRFWFHNKDDEGRPLDERILKAAEEIAPLLTRYRHQEIGCESKANDLLQSAIEAASKAKHLKPIRNPIAYITSVYRRIVDVYLDRLNRVIPVDDDLLEELSDSGHVESFEDLVNNRLVIEKLMDLMDEKTRQMCIGVLQGYSQTEIAENLGMPRNSLSVEFNRGLKNGARKIRHIFRRTKNR
jgi:RNA polymerase sigma factor (sigma-70 family)